MAAALAGGFVRAGLIKPTALVYHDPFPAAAAAFQKSAGGTAATTNREAAAASDILFLSLIHI